MKLNLGAADRHVDGFTCVDIAPSCNHCGRNPVDLAQPWPWANNSISEVMAMDVIEHIGDHARLAWRYDDMGPRLIGLIPVNGRIHFMNELHRVLAPAATSVIETPNASKGVGYMQDPTHRSTWCLSTFKYFESGAFAHTRLSKAYGITAAFKVLSLIELRSNGENAAEEVWKIRAVLEAVK